MMLSIIRSLALVSFVLGGCAITKTNDQARKDMNTEPEKVKTELASKVDQTRSLGPVLEKKPNDELEKNRRNIIDETIRNEDGNWKSFKVSLNFVDIDIRELAQALTQISGVNILVGDDVDGTVTIKVTNVPWDAALDNILRLKGLSKSVDNEANIIRIHKPETVLARDEFERKRIEEVAKQLAAKRIVSSQTTEIFKLYYTKPAKVKAQLEAIFGGGLPAAGAARPPGSIVEITVDDRLNSIVVKGTKKEIDLVTKLIAKLDVRTRQVLIEAFIVEASDNFQRELGVRLGYLQSTQTGPNTTRTIGGIVGGAASTPSGVTLGTGVGSVSNTAVGTGALGGIGYLWQTSTTALKAEINALEQLGLTKVVSNPKLFTMDNEEAVIIDGTQIPYPVAGVGANQITYEFKDAALKLTVTPTIIGDGNIYLNMVLNKDSPNYATTPPSIDKRELRNRLLVQDGTIAVVGGIYTQTNANNINKTPGLADIPLLGALFRDTQWQNNRRELLVYISTRILD